jgi:thymidylate synthase (FAD)
MKVIQPDYTIMTSISDCALQFIEKCGRVCYKSEDRITPDSASKFVSNIIKRGHESVLEHLSFTVRFVHNRGFTHELVRHRLAAYSQESTRYVNYTKNDEITFIEPYWKNDNMQAYADWDFMMHALEIQYINFVNAYKLPPQAARGILPNDIKTEIIMTANLREWRHVLKLRCSEAAHPDMQRVMIPLRTELQTFLPEVFG